MGGKRKEVRLIFKIKRYENFGNLGKMKNSGVVRALRLGRRRKNVKVVAGRG